MFSTRTIAIGLASILAAAGLAHGQVDPAAKEKLDKMVEAVKQAKSISYKVTCRGEGGFMSMLPAVELAVVLQHDPETPTQWKSSMIGRRAEVAGAGGAPALKIHVVSDGTKTTWVDDAAKTVTERYAASATSDHTMSATMGALRELTETQPYSKELTAAEMKLEKDVQADGAQCTVLFVDLGMGQHQSRWTVGPDNLPRKLERIMAGVGTQVWTLSDVKLNPEVPEGTFSISTPEGYTFASAVPKPVPQPANNTTTSVPVSRERAIGANLGDLAPDFELAGVDGKKVALSSLKGNVVLLSFGGTWHPQAKKSDPELQKLAEAYKDKPVKIIGLSIREASDEKPTAYMKDNNYTFGLLLKADDVAKDLFKVKVHPSYFVLAKDGEIRLVETGFKQDTPAKLAAAIDQALSGEPITKTVPSAPTAPNDGASDKPPAPTDGGE
jgi:peroxiredoxin